MKKVTKAQVKAQLAKKCESCGRVVHGADPIEECPTPFCGADLTEIQAFLPLKTTLEQLKKMYKGEIKPTMLDYLFVWKCNTFDGFLLIGNDQTVYGLQPGAKTVLINCGKLSPK